MKNPLILAGVEPATFRFVAQHLNHCATAVPINMKLVTTRFKSGGLYEKHVVATWNVGSHLSVCL